MQRPWGGKELVMVKAKEVEEAGRDLQELGRSPCSIPRAAGGEV